MSVVIANPEYILLIINSAFSSFLSIEMEPQTWIEPAYSNYAVNDRLEGGGDTEAVCITPDIY